MNSIKKEYKTDFLFPKQDFISGLGTIFNVAGNYYTFNHSSNPDIKAIESDWAMVGQDILESFDQAKKKKNFEN